MIASAREFEARFQKLLAVPRSEGDGSLGCERSKDCMDSTFCTDSQRLLRCHYCVRSSDSSDSSYLIDASRCRECSHCRGVENCVGCAYVIRSVGLRSCTYCFGCANLRGKDFHILNEPYERKAYFDTVAVLSKLLKLS